MANAADATRNLQLVIFQRTGISVSFAHAETLRRAAMTLHRWDEQECGDGNDYSSWAIERDEDTGIPYRAVYPHDGKPRRYRIPDREAGAIRRVKAVCKETGLHYFHQSDPRGAALYVSNLPLPPNNYTHGVAI